MFTCVIFYGPYVSFSLHIGKVKFLLKIGKLFFIMNVGGAKSEQNFRGQE